MSYVTRIPVAGGAGFVGATLVRRLAASGYRARVLAGSVARPAAGAANRRPVPWPAFSALVKAGPHVRTHKESTKVIRVYAEAVVADADSSAGQMCAGSENFSFSSPRHHRELGIRAPNRPVTSAVAAGLDAGHAGATPFR